MLRRRSIGRDIGRLHAVYGVDEGVTDNAILIYFIL